MYIGFINKKMGKSIVLSFFALFLFVGCSVESGPTVDWLFHHGQMSYAHSTKQLSKIPKTSKIYINDISEAIDMYGEDPAYSEVPFGKVCAPGDVTKKVLLKNGFNVVDREKDADYIIVMENIGCGRYKDIYKHLHNPKQIGLKIDNDIKTGAGQNAVSFVNLGQSFGNGAVSKGFAAIGMLSLFDSQSNKLTIFDAVTVIDKKHKKIEKSVFYTNCYGKGIDNIMNNGNLDIARKLSNEIE